ncbi:hypothetical protein ASF36_23525 [Methylobacterium sp. Leaf90]|nr:hypothetical protein ASF36_23525 [Methylobacterium sp. Leaf90]
MDIEVEIARISAILDAELVDTETTEDERREAIARWEQIKAEMGRSNVITERTAEEIDRERQEMRRANDLVEQRDAWERERAGLPARNAFTPRAKTAEWPAHDAVGTSAQQAAGRPDGPI